MTWSIIARSADGHFGIAIASRFFAVGALTMHSQGGVGALATQALMNPLYGPRGIERMRQGAGAATVIGSLIADDAGRAHRQVHAIGATGAPTAYTGTACIDWCGHRVFDDFSVAGNMLAGAQVLDATAQAYRENPALPLAERLIAAMRAGEAAGGDKRGRQAAALRIQTDEDYPVLDLRVDDHAQPIEELARLYACSLERFQAFVGCLAGRRDPVGLTDRADIDARVAAFAAGRGAIAAG